MSHVRPDHPHCRSATWICISNHTNELYIPSFIEICSRVSEPQKFKVCLFPLLCLLAFTTAGTTI